MRLQSSARSFQNKLPVLFLFFLLNILHLSAQTETPIRPIIEILKQIERDFDVSFSYNRRDIKKIKCELPPDLSTLEEVLERLNTNCNVKFYTIDERYIAVQLNTSQLISVCGTLINSDTGLPIQGATIITSTTQISTDVGGKFRFEAIPKDEMISIYFEGFKVKGLFAGELTSDQDCPIVFIDERFNYLPTVLLNSYLAKGIAKNAEGSVTISNSNFEILPNLIEPDVLRIAQILPGIESFDETASGINIRGGKSDEVLLIWDDIRMYQSGHFFGLISAFNPYLTQNVEIYKNGTHPRFGESVSGVISMKSNSEIPEQVTGAASIDFISAQFYAKIPASEKFAFHFSGRTSINTGIGNPVYKQFFDRVFQNTVVTNLETNTTDGLRSTDEAFNFYDINVKAIWQLSSKDKIQYNFLTIQNELQFTERFTGDTFLDKNVSELKQNTLVSGLSWKRDWTTNFSSKIVYNAVNYKNDGAIQKLVSGAIQSQRNEVDEQELQLDLTFTPTPELTFDAGYQYTDTGIINALSPFEFNEVIFNRSVLFSNAIYLNAKWKFFEKRSVVSAGVRFTDYPNLSQQFYEPRVNLFQKVAVGLSLTASAEIKHQAIGQTIDVQNNLLGIENERWIVLGNSVSPILENKQISLGAVYKKNNWNLSLEGFYKQVEGVNSGNQGFRNQLIDVNTVGGYEVNGFEVSVSKKTETLNTWLSYTYMDNQFQFDALNPAKFRNNFDVKHTLSLAVSYNWKSFLFALGTSYHSGIPYTPVIEGDEIIEVGGSPQINFSRVNSGTQNAFLRTDFSAAYTMKLDETFSGKINLALFNILNRRNALDTYYLLEFDIEGNPEVRRVEEFSLGFTPNISLQLLF